MWTNIYIRKGKAFIPALAKTEAGFYLEVEPVEVTDLEDRDAFAYAVARAFGRGMRHVPTPTAEDYKKPAVVASAAGYVSWSAFARGCRLFKVTQKVDGFYLFEERPQKGGAWLPAQTPLAVMPPESAVFEVGRRLFDLISEGE
jgi:hypothetical protein